MLWVGITRLCSAIHVTSTGLCCVSVARDGSARGLCWPAAGATGGCPVHSHRGSAGPQEGTEGPKASGGPSSGLIPGSLSCILLVTNLKASQIQGRRQRLHPLQGGDGSLQTHSARDGDLGRMKKNGPFCISLPHSGSKMTFFICPMGHKCSYPGVSLENSHVWPTDHQAAQQGDHEPDSSPNLPGFKSPFAP